MAAPDIEAGDITTNGDDTGSTTATINYAAYSVGDLVTFYLATDQDATHTIPTTGPNGDETILTLYANKTNGFGGPTSSAFGFIATSSESPGSQNVSLSKTEQWACASINTPAGEFHATTPYQTSVGDDSGTSATPATPAWASDATADGRVVGFVGVDTRTISGTASGWTVRANEDSYIRVKLIVTTRDAANSASESISAAVYSAAASDTWTSIGFIINGPAGASSANGMGRGIARGVGRGIG